MYEHKADFFEKRGDQIVDDDNDVKKYPLIMVPKNNDFDPQFPVMFYRKGKYVSLREAR